MGKVLFAMVTLLLLAGCGSRYGDATASRISRPVNTVWVGVDKFVYVPGSTAAYNFTYETQEGRIISPGLMYTDGGSIPRLAQALKGFSPWGFGPAYIVHDWIFYAQHCYVDRGEPDKAKYNDAWRFRDVYGYGKFDRLDFGDSADVLAAVIKTIVDDGEVKPETGPATVISSAVSSMFALGLWNKEGDCDRQRVRPNHIAMLWVRHDGGMSKAPPETWRLSPYEVGEARRFLPWARCVVARLVPGVARSCKRPPEPLPGGAEFAMAE